MAGNSIATDGKIESIAMDEGRVENTGTGGYKYEYYLQDHLFNNRVSFRVDHNGTANLSQVQNYYPFGGMMGDSTMNYSITPLDYYRYSGKELQPELDLNTYDFGARHYNPLLGRWMSMDPLAVSFDDETPYGYVGNNPLNMIDPDGMQQNGTITGGSIREVTITGHAGGGNIPAGSNSWANAFTWGGAAVNGVLQGINAFNAFKTSHTVVQNFGTFRTLQGNVIHPQDATKVVQMHIAPAEEESENERMEKREHVVQFLENAEAISDAYGSVPAKIVEKSHLGKALFLYKIRKNYLDLKTKRITNSEYKYEQTGTIMSFITSAAVASRYGTVPGILSGFAYDLYYKGIPGLSQYLHDQTAIWNNVGTPSDPMDKQGNW